MLWNPAEQQESRPGLTAEASAGPEIVLLDRAICPCQDQTSVLDQMTGAEIPCIHTYLEFLGEILERRIAGEVIMKALTKGLYRWGMLGAG